MDWWINKNRAVKSHGLVSVIIKAQKHCYIKIESVCFARLSVNEWAALCRVLHTQVCALAPLIVAPAVYLRINTESLTDTERTINNPFIILFEKTTVKYTDTQSSSLLPVKIKVRFLTRRNRQKWRL